ncbi:MAG: MBL fold metallo-hydrolase [Bacteroidota bacterium]|nr:MBL fold metallo-hydrolase [Bacteroidota bacterium]MDP4233121.1 MBL fold metallo-hydrolase [Bacteroidota bacterium]MDP4241734.1 MBL fold metallo-hydrolase [Bacteroidota bacterium]MDP4287392.1 MBL fold metallo-hydrolase [Bacteroidota bacterium]
MANTTIHEHPHALDRIREIEQKVVEIEKKVPRTIVRVEKKLIDFPFSRYFLGHQKPEDAKFKPEWRLWKNDRLTLAWLGQSTVLINFYGTWILTDPVFSERAGIHVGPITVGPRRLVQAPLKPDELPPIDLLLISHAHMDHSDIPSLRALRPAKHAIIAANTQKVYQGLNLPDLQVLDWGERKTYAANESHEIHESPESPITIEAIEPRHAGWRMPWDPCRSRKEKNGFSYNAYFIEKHDASGQWHAIVFGGDTGYTTSFLRLGDRMRAAGREIECAIMPIGTYNPWVETHCNPEQAWRMTREMNARAIVPVHWNTFTQSSEPRFEPLQWLHAVVDEPHAIALSEHGQTWTYPSDWPG